jgi:hypothetical protein
MYPKTLFAPTGGSVVVDDAAHERALGAGWLDNAPPDAPDVPDADATEVVVKEAAKRRR